MKLELKVSAGDVRSLFTKDRELLIAAFRHKDPRNSNKYSPNLFGNPLYTLMSFSSKDIQDYLRRAAEIDTDSLESSVIAAADTWRGLVAFLNEKQPYCLDRLVLQHVSQLRGFERLYNQLSGVSTAELPEKQAKSFKRGVAGLRTVIVRSNMLYNPMSRHSFLQHVSEGMLEPEYEQKLLKHLFSL